MKEPQKNKKPSVSPQVFHVQRKNRAKLTRKIIILFFVAVALVATVSAFVLLKENDFDLDNVRAALQPETESSTEEPTEPPELAGKYNILLSCTVDSQDVLRYVAIVNIDLNRISLNVCVIPVELSLTANGYTGNLSEQYAHGGMPQLALAMEEYTGIGIERYIHANETNFKKAIKLFGSIEYEVAQTAVCSMDGLTFTIDKGRQELTDDMLLRYVNYLCQQQDHAELGKVLCAILNETLTAENLARGDSLFRSLANLFDTDISVVDYTQYHSKIETFITDENRQPAVPVDGTSDF